MSSNDIWGWYWSSNLCLKIEEYTANINLNSWWYNYSMSDSSDKSCIGASWNINVGLFLSIQTLTLSIIWGWSPLSSRKCNVRQWLANALSKRTASGTFSSSFSFSFCLSSLMLNSVLKLQFLFAKWNLYFGGSSSKFCD